MYFSSELFVKRGPLGHLWLAGTLFHKLSKKVILSCNVPEMCKSIEKPPIPLALPARAQLFLGVCRIMDKQAKYLLMDATEAQSKVQLAVTTSLVNLTSNRVQAKSDSINIVCDVDDFFLPPIPLDCFENVIDKETALCLDQSNLDEFCLREGSSRLGNINLDFEINLPPQDTMVALEKTLFDPLEVMDGSEAPYSLMDPNQSLLCPEELGNGLDPLPDIMVEEPHEQPQSQGSVHSKATADPFNVSSISRKRKRNRLKPDSKIDINIDVLKHELADTSRIIIARPICLQEDSIHQSNEMQCMRSVIVSELADSLQACYEKESRREYPHVPLPVEEFNEDDHPPISPNGFEPMVEANEDILSFKSGNLSIERARHTSLLTDDDDQHLGNTFLGHEMKLQSPNVHSIGSEEVSPRQLRRVSMKSLTSLESRSRRLSSINETGVSDFQTPDVDLTISQFEIPQIAVEAAGADRSHCDNIDSATEILRGILEEHFRKIQGTPDDSAVCQFHSVIEAAVGPNIRVSRRDAALSFLQLLVLKTIGMVTVDQEIPYGPISIARTAMFSLNFSNSQIVGAL